jgi:hypothetical protein
MLIAGLGAIVPGIATFVGASKEDCTTLASGTEICHASKGAFVGQQVGISLISAGSTGLLFGIPAWAASTDPAPFPADNVGMGASGMVFTGIGAAFVVAGTASWIALTDKHAHEEQMMGGGVIGSMGVGLLALGLPLWIEGSEAPHGDEQHVGPALVWAPRDFVYRSPAMMAGGIGLIVTGAAGVVSTGVLGAMQNDYHSGGSSGMPPAMAACYTGVATAVLLGAGIPLVIYGAAKVPPNEASAKARPKGLPPAPRVRIGAGAADLSWTF